MIKEVIVVEGKYDVLAVQRAVDAECIITGGFSLSAHTIDKICRAYEKRGIIILTDPDTAGERIRKFLSKRFPLAKHAFIDRLAATANDDIGVEQAAPEVVRAALANVRYLEWRPVEIFTLADLLSARLVGVGNSAERRAAVGQLIGIGYANAKTFLYRLNHYGVTREEFHRAIEMSAESEGQ